MPLLPQAKLLRYQAIETARLGNGLYKLNELTGQWNWSTPGNQHCTYPSQPGGPTRGPADIGIFLRTLLLQIWKQNYYRIKRNPYIRDPIDSTNISTHLYLQTEPNRTDRKIDFARTDGQNRNIFGKSDPFIHSPSAFPPPCCDAVSVATAKRTES